MNKKRGMRNDTKQRYLDCINEIHLALNYNEAAKLQDICGRHNVSKSIPTYLRKHKIIRVSLIGHKWIDDKMTKSDIIDLMYEENRLANINAKAKKIKPLDKQLTIEPIQTTEKELKEWKSKVNDQISIKSELPIQNPEQKKCFELKIFGITIIKINR